MKMIKNKQNSQPITIFHDYPLPETQAKPVGYWDVSNPVGVKCE